MAGGAMTPIPTLTIASLYPNAVMPTFGLFVERRMRTAAMAWGWRAVPQRGMWG